MTPMNQMFRENLMKSNRIKLVTIVVFVLLVALVIVFRTTPVRGASMPDATADLYKAKCAMCHSPAAAKFYDPAMPEDEQVKIILEGKKAAKPPHMPAFADKGIDAAGAKALAEYMKCLRQAT
jgi:mono/diheme cytochrome c family protein